MMTGDARDRQQLREKLEATLGERPAEVLMEHLFDEGASEVGTRLAGLDLRMDAMCGRMDAMCERMDAMLVLFERRFEAVEQRFDAVEERLGRIEPGLEKLDDRIHTIQNTVMTSFLVTTFSSWGLVLAAMALT